MGIYIFFINTAYLKCVPRQQSIVRLVVALRASTQRPQSNKPFCWFCWTNVRISIPTCSVCCPKYPLVCRTMGINWTFFGIISITYLLQLKGHELLSKPSLCQPFIGNGNVSKCSISSTTFNALQQSKQPTRCQQNQLLFRIDPTIEYYLGMFINNDMICKKKNNKLLCMILIQCVQMYVIFNIYFRNSHV